jgi:hypothetical protein
MITDYTFTTPKQLLQHLNLNKRKSVGQANKGLFYNWVVKGMLWYNSNICKCKKKGMTEEQIIDGFKEIVKYSTEEQQKAVIIIGGSAAFIWNEELLGTIS